MVRTAIRTTPFDHSAGAAGTGDRSGCNSRHDLVEPRLRQTKEDATAAQETQSEQGFEHLREHSIGLAQVVFQSITHMAPAAAVAYSIYISVPYAQQALPLSVGLALIACICAAAAIGQLAKLPSAGGMYTYAGRRALGRVARGLALRGLPAARLPPPRRRGLGRRLQGDGLREFKTPHIAIISMSAFALILSLLVGWKWNPGIGFGVIATPAVPLVIIVYMLVCVGTIVHYWRERRSEFNWLLHSVLPIGGIVLFFLPLYYQLWELPPPYPFKYGNW